MAIAEAIFTTAGGAVSSMLGVAVGGAITRRAQDRHWIRDKQSAYQELLRQFSGFTMVLRQAHLDRSSWHYDWAGLSAALTSVSIVAPPDAVIGVDKFGQAVNNILEKVAVDPTETALSEIELDREMQALARSQVSLVNVFRRSLDAKQEALSI